MFRTVPRVLVIVLTITYLDICVFSYCRSFICSHFQPLCIFHVFTFRNTITFSFCSQFGTFTSLQFQQIRFVKQLHMCMCLQIQYVQMFHVFGFSIFARVQYFDVLIFSHVYYSRIFINKFIASQYLRIPNNIAWPIYRTSTLFAFSYFPTSDLQNK